MADPKLTRPVRITTTTIRAEARSTEPPQTREPAYEFSNGRRFTVPVKQPSK